VTVRSALLRGDPAAVLRRESAAAALLVMGAGSDRPYGGLPGTVTQCLLRHSPAPLLIVRGVHQSFHHRRRPAGKDSIVPTDATLHPNATTADALYAAATAAGYAPSIHNTQPWRWRLAGDVLDLYADRSRVLGVTDPDSRLATLSCGTALHHARIALAAQGWHAVVERLPDPADPDHLARVRIDGPGSIEPYTIRLAQSIRQRHTDRRPATGAPVAAQALGDITAAVETEATSLHILRPDQVLDLAAATSHAQGAEAAETLWQDELAHWAGGDGASGVGVPDAVIPQAAPQTTVPGRDFGRLGDLPSIAGHDESAIFGVLYGPGDERHDWLRAGEALSAAWLTATAQGVSLLPFSAPIEVGGAREVVRRLVAGLGHPYMAVRLGTATPDGEAARTPRLAADQIIERS
jgi:nitroreductase